MAEPDDDSKASLRGSRRGPLAWMAQNPVAANLLMLVLVIGGLLMLPRIKQEVFPEFELDLVLVNVAYPGASPAEVEQGVVLAIEEAVRGVEGVKEVRSTATEGMAVVAIELLLNSDSNRALADVKSAVDRVTSFPKDIERPIVSLAQTRREVVSLVVYGDQTEKALRDIGDNIREEILTNDKITVVELAGVRPLEVSVEVPQEELRRYNLTLEQVAAKVQAASVEVPGGGVKTSSGEVLVRTTERRDRGNEFGEIAVLSRPDGSQVKLSEIATIKDAFRETDQEAFFNGRRAVMVKVFRAGDQKPLEISDIVKQYVHKKEGNLPPGVKLAIWADTSEIYGDRVNLLLRNGLQGLILVFVTLGLFLELRLAFWVTMGIPISFAGALLFLPVVDASVNMISLFAFIVTLGIVVDDAIVVGEAIYKRRSDGASPMSAAIEGVREVGMPVIFGVTTTLVAFAPLLFVPGIMGKFFRIIPLVVIAVLSISLIESLFVLPAHLAHSRGAASRGILGFINRQQNRVSRGIEWLIEKSYVPLLEGAVRRRYLTMALGLATLIGALGLVAGGRVKSTFFPKVDGDVIVAELTMPFGTSAEQTRRVQSRLVKTAQEVIAEHGGEEKIGRGIFSQIGASGSMTGGPRGANGNSGGHLAEAAVFLVPVDQRDLTATEFAREWRKRMGDVAGAESLKFTYSTGPSGGDPINVELSHRDISTLEAAADEVAKRLKDYAGVFDIDDGFSPGKEQLDMKLKPEAKALGITEIDLARQVRSSFFGAEAVRQQRGRDELRVYVRLPESQRQSEHDIETLLIKTPQGGEVPIDQAVSMQRGRAFTEITRRDGRRVVSVTADIDPAVTNADQVLKDFQKDVLPGVVTQYDGLTFSLEGEQKQQRETMQSLGNGFIMALIAIFAMLAIPLKSYLQPLIIMAVIPFGMVGAIVGHVVMGYDISLMSMMGIVALAGVVVNDSLILIVAINELRGSGASVHDAIVAGGHRRFRPIILTSLTTFFGLMPMIVETSVQARFLIPMAISLGFGVLFSTIITLLMVPCIYAMLEDVKRGWRFVRGDEAGVPLPGE